jgi:hypothetical protein
MMKRQKEVALLGRAHVPNHEIMEYLLEIQLPDGAWAWRVRTSNPDDILLCLSALVRAGAFAI